MYEDFGHTANAENGRPTLSHRKKREKKKEGCGACDASVLSFNMGGGKQGMWLVDASHGRGCLYWQ